MGFAANDPVEGVTAGPVPCCQEKPTRRYVFLAIKDFQKRNEFVPEGESPVGVVRQNDAKSLISRIIDDIAPCLRFLWRFYKERRCVRRSGRESLSGLLLRVFFLQFGKLNS